MNFKNLFLSTAVAINSFFVASNIPCFALPGDSIQSSIARFQRQPLLKNIKFKNSLAANYESTVRYNNEVVSINIFSPNNAFSDIREFIYIQNSSIGVGLPYDSYDPRREKDLSIIISALWGKDVERDFLNSRFTNRFKLEEAGTVYRNIYVGRKFGYEVKCEVNREGSLRSGQLDFNFTILSLSDIKYSQLPSEF